MNHALFCPRGGKAVTKDTDAREGEAALRLRTLELQGFKSFPDHTVLTFDHPVTAIVGPNGSGKSNLSDAICWVLGEQSARTLRGDKMEDVIFGGTRRRGAMGFAQVRLTLDNAAHTLDVDADEVTIGRKYYRSGDSEYTITTGSYSDTADLSGATAIQDQSVYTVEKPDQL